MEKFLESIIAVAKGMIDKGEPIFKFGPHKDIAGFCRVMANSLSIISTKHNQTNSKFIKLYRLYDADSIQSLCIAHGRDEEHPYKAFTKAIKILATEYNKLYPEESTVIPCIVIEETLDRSINDYKVNLDECIIDLYGATVADDQVVVLQRLKSDSCIIWANINLGGWHIPVPN